MASECKLCCLLGATTLNDLLDGNQVTHAQLHARQLELIGQNHKELTIDKLQTFLINRSLTSNGNGKFPKEKSKKSALFRFCRELVNNFGKDGGMKCSQCKKSIKSQRCTTTAAKSLINHACVHLNKDLFACRQCHLKFVSKGGVCQHLRSIHSLSRILANYIDMTDDHHNDIMDMVKLCFGEACKKQLNVTPFGRQKRNIQGHVTLMKLSYNFIAKHQHGDRIQCNFCPRSIPKNNRKNAAKSLLDHGRWHLDKPIFICRLCKYSASTAGTIAMHLTCVHSVARSKQNFMDGSSEYFEEISSMMEDCFGDMKKERPPPINKEEKRTRRAQLRITSRREVNSLLAERQLRCAELAQKFQQSCKLQCRICHVHLVVVTAGKAMQHALSHLNKILFSCRRCSHTSTTKTAMGQHVRTKHGVPETNQFDDRTDDSHADFMDMLSKCFDWDLEPERTDAPVRAPFVTKILTITSKMHGKELKAARHIRASELIRKHSTNGKILCRICSHSSSVLGGRSQLVFIHAMRHLDKRCWPFHCMFCSFMTVQQQNIRGHLQTAHKDKDAEEFEDLSDKFHTETMEILSKCYDWCVEPGQVS